MKPRSLVAGFEKAAADEGDAHDFEVIGHDAMKLACHASATAGENAANGSSMSGVI